MKPDMNVQIRQKTVDVLVAQNGLTADVVNTNDYSNGKYFKLHYSLMGEVTPVLSPLSLEYAFDGETTAYRYDWVVGISAIEPWTFDWRRDLNDQRALCVQLLIDCGGSGLSFTEISATLLGLQPSETSTSWLERHFDKIGDSLTAISDIAKPINSTAFSLLKVSAVMSNFVQAGSHDKKNWFLYRFFDETEQCSAVEWNIHKPVIQQFGPLLRGSIILTFHGTAGGSSPIRMLLRPNLALAKTPFLQYIPPYTQLESDNPVILEITPKLKEG